jgi:hypothetical protein
MKKRLKKAANTGDLQDSLTYLLLVMCVDIPKRADYNDLKMVMKNQLGELRNHACRE